MKIDANFVIIMKKCVFLSCDIGNLEGRSMLTGFSVTDNKCQQTINSDAKYYFPINSII